jgi:hypothetical protein
MIGYRGARRPALQTSVLYRHEGSAGEEEERHAGDVFAAGQRQSTSLSNSANKSGAAAAKLKAARDRRIAAGEKCGGRKSYAEARPENRALSSLL